MENYTIQKKIGAGAYGEVYRGIDKRSGTVVAFKKIKNEIVEDGIPATALREIVLLKQALVDVILEPGKYSLVFEMMDGDLYFLLKNAGGPLSEELVQSYSSQLLEGLAYCHSRGVMHRDLKPQNLLISKDGGIKIADFGLARAFSFRSLTVEVVTPWYRAPEVLLGSNTYGNSIDIWSAACIIVEMSTNKVLFEGKCDVDQLHLIFRLFGTPDESRWPGIGQLPYWRDSFPSWQRNAQWGVIAPALTTDGHTLLEAMFTYLPESRPSAAICIESYSYAKNRYATT